MGEGKRGGGTLQQYQVACPVGPVVPLALALAKHLANIYDARNWRAINNEWGGGRAVRYNGCRCVQRLNMLFFCIFVIFFFLHAGVRFARWRRREITSRRRRSCDRAKWAAAGQKH